MHFTPSLNNFQDRILEGESYRKNFTPKFRTEDNTKSKIVDDKKIEEG